MYSITMVNIKIENFKLVDIAPTSIINVKSFEVVDKILSITLIDGVVLQYLTCNIASFRMYENVKTGKDPLVVNIVFN